MFRSNEDLPLGVSVNSLCMSYDGVAACTGCMLLSSQCDNFSHQST